MCVCAGHANVYTSKTGCRPSYFPCGALSGKFPEFLCVPASDAQGTKDEGRKLRFNSSCDLYTLFTLDMDGSTPGLSSLV